MTLIGFQGIPYLKPPVGDLRWKYDDLLIKSDDVNYCNNNNSDIKAEEFRGPCFQSNPYGGNSDPYIGTEDCLYLNVWTPNIAADPEDDRPRYITDLLDDRSTRTQANTYTASLQYAEEATCISA